MWVFTVCTSVIPSCLSSGLAKSGKITSMFVLFSRLFGHVESLAFFENGGGGTLHQSNQTRCLTLSGLAFSVVRQAGGGTLRGLDAKNQA